eukprot:5352702-Amphidinium_carterae.1
MENGLWCLSTLRRIPSQNKPGLVDVLVLHCAGAYSDFNGRLLDQTLVVFYLPRCGRPLRMLGRCVLPLVSVVLVRKASMQLHIDRPCLNWACRRNMCTWLIPIRWLSPTQWKQ